MAPSFSPKIYFARIRILPSGWAAALISGAGQSQSRVGQGRAIQLR